MRNGTDAIKDFESFLGKRKFATVMADPSWRFANRTGKMASEYK